MEELLANSSFAELKQGSIIKGKIIEIRQNEVVVDIDGNFDYNDARFINHACRTNCEAINEDDTIWIYATRDISKGEELLYNYGYALEHFINNPCKCGFPECVGYIVAVEDRLKLKKLLKGRKPKHLKK